MAKINKNIIQQVVQQTVKKAVKQNIPTDSRLLEQFVKYQQNGLNYRSNDNDINVRNSNGNLVLNLDSENNPLLIIEPTSTNIINKSILKVIDTQFNYFKFPATTRIIGTDDIGIDLNLDLSGPVNDPIFARYKPSKNAKILAGAKSGILIDELEEGQLQKRPNKYYITKEIKESGADLRFRVKINFRYDSIPPPEGTVEYTSWQDDTDDHNTTYFYIARSGPNKDTKRDYISYFDFEDPDAGGGKILRYQVQNAYKDVIIANSEFEVGDTFSITAEAGKNDTNKYSTINADQTYWSITDASKNVDEWNREI